MVKVTTKEYNDVRVIAINGEFYLESIDRVEKIWKQQIAKKPRVIGFDCSKIAFIDSSGIGALVKFLNNSIKLDIELVFFDLSPTFTYVFEAARLANFFKTMTRDEFEAKYLNGF